MTIDEDFDIPGTGAIFTFGKSRFAENAPSKFWIKNDIICKVGCGDDHTAVVTGSGRVFTIGNNSDGQLGLGSRKSVVKPSCVKGLKPQRVVQVACGRAHTVAATEIGCVFAWGHNGDGQLGIGNYEDKDYPMEVLKLPTAPIQLAAGSTHSMLLTDKGEIYVWGSNKEGQLGCDGETKLTPTKLTLGFKIASIACGYYHSLAITDDCKLITWGEAEHGKLGLSKDLLIYQRFPQPTNLDEKVVMVVAGTSHTLALTESGVIWSCGMGSSGQLGQGVSVLEQQVFKPVSGVEGLRFVYISAGANHSAAISEEGLVYTWGCGRHGKLCLGEQSFSPQFIPTLVSRLRHLTAVQVECGGCHTMVLGYRRGDNAGPNTISQALRREAKVLAERMVNQLENQSAQRCLKERVLPTVPSGVVRSESALDQQPEETTIPLQDNYLNLAEEAEKLEYDIASSEGLEENHRKASRFARFWNAIIRRETVAPSYKSGGVESCSKSPEQEPKVEELEEDIDKPPHECEEEEEEDEETGKEEVKDRNLPEVEPPNETPSEGKEEVVDIPVAVKAKTCVLV